MAGERNPAVPHLLSASSLSRGRLWSSDFNSSAITEEMSSFPKRKIQWPVGLWGHQQMLPGPSPSPQLESRAKVGRLCLSTTSAAFQRPVGQCWAQTTLWPLPLLPLLYSPYCGPHLAPPVWPQETLGPLERTFPTLRPVGQTHPPHCSLFSFVSPGFIHLSLGPPFETQHTWFSIALPVRAIF